MVGNGSKDPRITSLDEARQRKAEAEKVARRAAQKATRADSGSTMGQQLFGIAMIVFAVGFIAWFIGGAAGVSGMPEVIQ